MGCLSSLDGPVINVLRKAFQTKYEEIQALIAQDESILNRLEQLVDQLGLGSSERSETL